MTSAPEAVKGETGGRAKTLWPLRAGLIRRQIAPSWPACAASAKAAQNGRRAARVLRLAVGRRCRAAGQGEKP